jgi:hypothetical protein
MSARHPMRAGPCMPLLRGECLMLDLLFFGGGFALFCLLIAYERLCNRL